MSNYLSLVFTVYNNDESIKTKKHRECHLLSILYTLYAVHFFVVLIEWINGGKAIKIPK